MVVRRKKKSRSYRGYRTHGYGSIGQHRKSGSKGGVGLAGFHKHRWSWVVKYFPDWYGKHGFTRPPNIKEEYNTINVGELAELIKELASSGKLTKDRGYYVIDLSTLGINKLLGRGRIDFKVKVTVYAATERAINKIEEAGGKVILLSEASES